MASGEFGTKARDVAASVKKKGKATNESVAELAELTILLADKMDWLNEAAKVCAGKDWEPPKSTA